MTGNDVKSNMAIMEINVPSGFIVDKESLEATRNNIGTVKRVETKNADTVAVVYLDYIDRTKLALTFHGSRKHEVEHLKPALIAVYDYYDSGKYFANKIVLIALIIFIIVLNCRASSREFLFVAGPIK